MSYTYDYPHPAVTVDVVVFTVDEDALKVLLIERGLEPYAGCWAIPGGFVGMRESLRRAAWRELREETGVHAASLQQLGAFGRPDRDPRERVISVAYYALVARDRLQIRAASDANDARLFCVDDLPRLAFDHERILQQALAHLHKRVDEPLVPLQLLPAEFTLTELQRCYEIVNGEAIDKRNFRKRFLALGLVEPTGRLKRAGAHRPAKLFRIIDTANLPWRSTQSGSPG